MSMLSRGCKHACTRCINPPQAKKIIKTETKVHVEAIEEIKADEREP